ncbi:hypothetical protein ACFY71_40400 [Streptomyces cinerochromogenes]|uniref:hypothetical protein n=1 Tax=Streptomyces cinerochromogenes TaxID=66422 RepID=UPI0036B36213
MSPDSAAALQTDLQTLFVLTYAATGPEHQEHDQAVPEQKAGGTWLSRFRG